MTLLPIDTLIQYPSQSDRENYLSPTTFPCEVFIQFSLNLSSINERTIVFVSDYQTPVFPKEIGKAHWLIPESKINHLLDRTHPQLNSNVYIYSPSLEIFEIYQIKGGPIRRNKLLHWDSLSQTFERRCKKGILDRRSDLSGIHIDAATKSWSPMNQVKQNSQGLEFKGFYHDVFKAMSVLSNFTYQIKFLESDEFGTLGSDGQWTGILARIQNKQFDITLPGYMYEIMKLEAFDLIHLDNALMTIVLSDIPVKPTFGFEAYVTVLTFSAWFGTGIFLLTILLLSHFVLGSDWEFLQNMIYIIKAFCQQSSAAPTKKLSQRMFCLVIGIFGPVFFIEYTAMLVSDFRTQPDIYRIETFEDILDKGYRFAIWNDSPSARFLASSADPALVALHKNLAYFYNYTEAHELLASNPKIAAWVHQPTFDLSYLHNPDFKQFLVMPSGYVLPKNSEFTELFKFLTMQIREAGIMAFDFKASYNRRIILKDTMDHKAVSIAFHHLLIPCGIMVAGIIAAIITGIFEIIFKKQKALL